MKLIQNKLDKGIVNDTDIELWKIPALISMKATGSFGSGSKKKQDQSVPYGHAQNPIH